MLQVTIVVPCYNEADRLEVEKWLEFDLPLHKLRFLFVNDGSSDQTLQVLETMVARCPERIALLNLETNGGKAEAVRRGFLNAMLATPDYIGFWDADLATPLEEIPKLCAAFDQDQHTDMVFGSRVRLLGRSIERKAHRHYFGRMLATAVSTALDMRIYDSQCGAKLFRNNTLLRQAFADPFTSGWLFDVEVIARCKRLYRAQGVDVSTRVFELPLRNWQDIEGSKTRPSDAVVAFYNLARIYRTYLRK